MIAVKNAPKWLIFANALQNALFILPVIMLFYGYKNVGMGDFFLIQGCSALTIFLLEIPTGYLGDVFSRKGNVLAGLLMWIAGYLLWILGSGFWFILVGELLFGVALALTSGTLDAYLYDLLKKDGNERIFHKYIARKETWENVSLFITTLTGSFIYQWICPEATVWLSILCLLAAVVIVLCMPDVPEARRKVEKGKSKIKDILDIAKCAVKHPEIKWFMLYAALLSTLTLVLMWGLQSVMIVREIPVYLFSIVVGINSLIRAMWSYCSPKLLVRFNVSGVVVLLFMVVVMASLAAGIAEYVPIYLVYVCLGIMVIGAAARALTLVVTTTFINERISSNERSTVLSVSSMVERMFGALAMIGFKPLLDSIGVGPTFIVVSLLLVPIFLVSARVYKMRLGGLEVRD